MALKVTDGAGDPAQLASDVLGDVHTTHHRVTNLPGTTEADLAASRGFLATIAAAVPGGRMAVDLTTAVTGFLQTLAAAVPSGRMLVDLATTPTANLATLASAISSGSMKAVLQAGTAVIGKLAANAGINIGTVDVASGSVALSAPIPAGTNILGKVDVNSTPSLPPGTNAIGKLVHNPGINIGTVDAVTAQLPSSLGEKTKAGSLSVTVANDEVVEVYASQLPANLGQKAVSGSLPVTMAAGQPAQDVTVVNVGGIPVTDSTAQTTLAAVAAKLDAVIAAQGPPAALYGGRTTVPTAGTRVVLGSSQALTEGVLLRGIDTNTGIVYPGNSTVTATTNGSRLGAKEKDFIRCNNVNRVYLDAAVSGEGVTWIGW
jgi:hypothetical protein